jgi:hypothetical protein
VARPFRRTPLYIIWGIPTDGCRCPCEMAPPPWGPQVESVVLAGHSMGAAVCCEAARRLLDADTAVAGGGAATARCDAAPASGADAAGAAGGSGSCYHGP